MAIRTYGPNAVDWEQRIDLGPAARRAAGPAAGRSWSGRSSARC